MIELTDNELATLENLVSSREEWALLKKVFRAEIDRLWDIVRLTDPKDEGRVVTNHRLALAAEAALGDIVKEMESVNFVRKHPIPEVIDDQTKSLYQ